MSKLKVGDRVRFRLKKGIRKCPVSTFTDYRDHLRNDGKYGIIDSISENSTCSRMKDFEGTLFSVEFEEYEHSHMIMLGELEYKVKDTKIARAFYKGKIEKAEEGYLWIQ